MRLPAMTDIRPAFSDEDLADLRIDGSMNMVGNQDSECRQDF